MRVYSVTDSSINLVEGEIINMSPVWTSRTDESGYGRVTSFIVQFKDNNKYYAVVINKEDAEEFAKCIMSAEDALV